MADKSQSPCAFVEVFGIDVEACGVYYKKTQTILTSYIAQVSYLFFA